MNFSKKIAVESELFQQIDLHFADFIVRLHGTYDADLYLLAILVSHFTGKQHTALKFKNGQSLKSLFADYGVETELFEDVNLPTVDLSKWSKVLGEVGGKTPLVYDSSQSLLYLYRYWFYENNVADFIKARTNSFEDFEFSKLKSIMAKLFEPSGPSASYDPINWQEVAAFTALTNRFSVISGGPGTGKTTTVAKVLALLVTSQPNLKIDLVAPTGKAADQLVKSIRSAKERIPFDELGISPDSIPEESCTIQRFLGYIPGASTFRYNAENKKATQLLLVDEASMVSLPLFSKLFAALNENCRVILLGDKDQLAAVENGNVLGDITEAEQINQFSPQFVDGFSKIANCSKHPENLPVSENPAALEDSVVQLEFSYRFNQNSGIGELSRLVNCQDLSCIELMKTKGEGTFSDIELKELPEVELLNDSIRQFINEADKRCGFLNYRRAVKAGDPLHALKLFDKARVLCAVNSGVYGVENVNKIIEDALFIGKLDKFYIGRPIIVLKNDHNLKIYNGDVGIIMKDGNGVMKAFFPDGDSEVKAISPASLPEHATAFAMTIHKSQGSEFNDVLMILPDKFSPVLTKEIVYTGITRAKSNIEIWSSERILKQTIQNPIKRTSGLRAKL